MRSGFKLQINYLFKKDGEQIPAFTAPINQSEKIYATIIELEKINPDDFIKGTLTNYKKPKMKITFQTRDELIQALKFYLTQ